MQHHYGETEHEQCDSRHPLTNRDTSSRYETIDWGSALTEAGYLELGEAHFDWAETTTPDLLASRVRSVSYIADAPSHEQQGYVNRVLALVGSFGPSFPLPYVTHLWWGRTPI